MKIGIDTNILAIDNAGASVYTRELINNLVILDKNNSYDFFSYGPVRSQGKSFKSRLDNLIRDTVWGQLVLPHEIKKRNIDLLHCPAFKAPLNCSVPLIVTFYDIHIIKKPGDYNLWLGLYCNFMLSKIARAADIIITISEFSKKDIVNTFSIPETKVVVTYCGIDKRFQVIADQGIKDAVRKKYGLDRNFILYVGSIQPRKNLSSLLKAYAQLKKNRFFDYQLVFAGDSGWRNKDILALIEELDISDGIKFLGYVPDYDLPVIYNTADFFVYPSFFEGFGMPVLEAMACGCPVITSNVSSLPEVVGNAGIKINPHNFIELKGAMETFAKDSRLKRDMRDKGIERAKIFSWEKCALETLKVYEGSVK